MQKTTEQLQADLDREKAYTTKLNRQIDRLRDQLRGTISLSEHERILASVRRECETKLTAGQFFLLVRLLMDTQGEYAEADFLNKVEVANDLGIQFMKTEGWKTSLSGGDF